MSATVALLGLAVYLVGAAAFLSWSLRQIDVTFVRDMNRVLRSRTPGGSGEDAGRRLPLASPATAGGDARGPDFVAALPPAPLTSGGRGCPPSPAPARPPRVTVHG